MLAEFGFSAAEIDAPVRGKRGSLAAMAKLLEVRNLKTTFLTAAGVVRAVDGVSWDVAEGETVALVGESGCGKSVSALSIMRLVAEPAGRIVGGEILFKGRDLLKLTEEEMRQRARPRDRDGLPGADDLAQPGAHHRAAAHRGPRDPPAA